MMKHRIINHDDKETDFIQKSAASNRMILRVAVAFTMVVELFNLIRVLFFTNAGLTTINNRIYFAFYLVYFVGCIVFFALDFGLKRSVKGRYRFYLVCGSAMMLWHTLFNMYDVYRANAAGSFTVLTAMAILCFLLLSKPLYAILNLGLSYLLFVSFLCRYCSSGEVINFTITTFLCAFVYVARYKHVCVELSQAKLINDMQEELSQTRRNFRLSVEQYEMIRKKGSYVTFEWDVKTDRIRFSEDWNDYFNAPKEIPHFKKFILESKEIQPVHQQALLACLRGIKDGVPAQSCELMLPRKNGKDAWFDLRAITQTNEQGEPIFGIGILSDISEQKAKLQLLEEEAKRDRFTGLLNKTAIEYYGERKLKELQDGELLAMLILDMDGFKQINDTFGHPVGDFVLKEVADLMQMRMPAGTRIGRIGGDEFAALFLTDDISSFERAASELRLQIPQIRWQGRDIGARCSIGISSTDSKDSGYAELYRLADEALYQAKRQGKQEACGEGQTCPIEA